MDDVKTILLFSLIENWFDNCLPIAETVTNNPVHTDGAERESLPFGDGHYMIWGPLAPSYFIEVKEYTD